VHVGREQFLAGAIERQATHVLWLDTDMTFPPDTAIRLAQHDKPVVSCQYVMRHTSTVTDQGMGVMLMSTSIVKDLLRPWFCHGRNAAGQDVGEDIGFCRALRASGYEIHIDRELSQEIGHVGLHTYRLPAHPAVAV
jgi:hypothetical protein